MQEYVEHWMTSTVALTSVVTLSVVNLTSVLILTSILAMASVVTVTSVVTVMSVVAVTSVRIIRGWLDFSWYAPCGYVLCFCWRIAIGGYTLVEVLTSFCRYYGDCIARVCNILSTWCDSEHVDFIACKILEQVSVIGVAIGFKKPTDVVGELLEPHQIVTDRLRQWKVWPIYQRWRWGYTGYCYIPGGDSFRLEYKINDNNILILKCLNRNIWNNA